MIANAHENTLIDFDIERTVIAMMSMNKMSCLKAAAVLMESDFTDNTMRVAFAELKEHKHDENRERQTAMILRIRSMASNPRNALASLTRALIDNDHLRSTTYGLDMYIDRLVNLSMRRAMCMMADKLTQAAESLDNGYMDVMRSQYDAIMSRSTVVSELPTLVDLAMQRLEDMTAEKIAANRLMSGIRVIDSTVGGFDRGEVVVIAGQPGMGKSALALQIATTAAIEGKAVCYLTLELTKNALIDRMFANLADVPFKHILDATMTKEQRHAMVDVANRMAAWRFVINDLGGATMDLIRALIDKQHNEQGVDLIVVDYLQLIQSRNTGQKGRTEIVDAISREMKAIAKDVGAPLLMLCQLNREGEKDDNPKLQHLRESGAMGQDCDIALLLSKRELEAGEKAVAFSKPVKVHVAKNRKGEEAKLDVVFIGRHQRFIDVPHDPLDNQFNDYDNDDSGFA